MAFPPKKVPRVFLDASVLIAAAISPTGAARELILRGVRGEVELAISPLVEEETRRNLAEKAPAALPFYELLLEVLSFTRATPSSSRVEGVALTIAMKDAPIVAACIEAGADFLATWDKRHLLSAKNEGARLGVAIMTPSEVLDALPETGE